MTTGYVPQPGDKVLVRGTITEDKGTGYRGVVIKDSIGTVTLMLPAADVVGPAAAPADPNARSLAQLVEQQNEAITEINVALAKSEAERDALAAEITKLADFIMFEVPGEPSQSESAVDTAIRLVRRALAKLEEEK